MLQICASLLLCHGLQGTHTRHLIELFFLLLSLLATHLVKLLLGELAFFVKAIEIILPE